MSASAAQLEVQSQARRYFERRGEGTGQWREIAELGWLGAAIPEALGGYGGEDELVVLAQEVGAALAADPLLEAGVFPATFLAYIPLEGVHAGLLDRFIGGEARICAASPGPGASPEAGVRCDAQDNGRLRLSGGLRGVLGAEDADSFLICAHDPAAPGGRRVLLVDRQTANLACEILPAIDGRGIANLDLSGVELSPDAAIGGAGAPDAFDQALDAAILGQCAELVGLMDRMFGLTRDYLQTRRQFGQTLSNFQALRHRLADMFAELEQARAILGLGVEGLQSGSPSRRRWAVSACKLRIGRAARFVGAQAIQLHGAIAMTEEYVLGRCYKRILVARKTWGDEEVHARRMAQNRPASPFGPEEA